MTATIKYGVYEKEVKAVLGDKYDLLSFVEGVDYKRYKVKYGTRVAFRNGILEELRGPVVVSNDTIVPVDAPERSEPQVVGESQVVSEPQVQSANVGEATRDAIVTQKYPNPRYVNTTIGRVFVGGKPVKVGQTIVVKDHILVLKPTVGTV